MSNTNTGNGITNPLDGLKRLFSIDLSKYIKHNNTLNTLISTGKYDVPYAFMGLVTIAVGSFTYVTYMDYSTSPPEIENEEIEEPFDEEEGTMLGSLIENIGENIQENSGENVEEKVEENTGENAEEKVEENTGENSGENAEEKVEEHTGENSGENMEEKVEENSGEKVQENVVTEDKKGGKTRVKKSKSKRRSRKKK